jgi:23S rRNA pseudouridine1911/1915/1917 synthase
MNIPVIFEDDNYIIVNKPAGLVVHYDGKTKEPTLADWILENYPKMKEVGEPLVIASGEKIFRPGIVHRIDRDTSGVLVLTKNQKAFTDLKEKFKKREVSKTYHAFVYGAISESEGIIDRPIGRSRKDFRLWSAQRGARGEMREAVTHYKVLGKNEKASFIEVSPKTGRTHQIRVHFKAINHPIIADALYAPKRASELDFERLALHSYEIRFKGIDGKEIQAKAPYPKDFARALKKISA